MAVPPQTTRVSYGGITDTYNTITFLYGGGATKPVVPWATMIAYNLTVITIMNFWDNV